MLINWLVRVLALFEMTVDVILSVPVLAFFAGVLVLLVVIGLFSLFVRTGRRDSR